MLSASALGLEITLMRLFQVMLWQNFAAMIISLTLLGYGASGTALAFLGPRLARRPWTAFGGLAAAFGVLAPICFMAASAMQFNPLEVLWQPGQFARLAMVYILLGVPFFAAGGAIGLALYSFPQISGRIYAADLLGAGLGPAVAIGLMLVLPYESCLAVLSGAAMLAAASAFLADGSHSAALSALVLGLAIALLLPHRPLAPRMSQYKDLPRTLTLPDARILEESSGPLGLLHTAVSPEIPIRYAAGLSLQAETGPPRQIGVYADGHSAGVINMPDPWQGIGSKAFEYLEHSLTALPHLLVDAPKVFLSASTGHGDPAVIQAFRNGAKSVDHAAPNPRLAEMTAGLPAERDPGASKYLMSHEVRARPGAARSVLASETGTYDLIVDDMTKGNTAATAVSGGRLMTVQGVEAMLERLSPHGLIAVAAAMRYPPREPLKVVSTAAGALRREGLDPAKHLMVFRSWDLALVVIAKSPIRNDAIRTARGFCREEGFDTAYFPGMQPESANRRNKLERPLVYLGTARILSDDRDEFFSDYRFDVRPATDDRPFFGHFLKPETLVELLGKRGSGGLSLVRRDYPITVVTVVQAAVAGLAIILLPLVLARALGRGRAIPPRAGAYFLLLGLSFLALEIAFLNMFSLSLGNPLLGAGLAVGVFLVFAGIGSRASAAFCGSRDSARKALILAVLGVAILSGGAYALLAQGSGWLLAKPLLPRAALISAAVAPAALCMGMPFPLGLFLVGETGRYPVAWGWGINGWASVLSAALTQLLAVHFGFGWIVAGASGLYVLAGLTFRP
jgi:hypothetical protein